MDRVIKKKIPTEEIIKTLLSVIEKSVSDDTYTVIDIVTKSCIPEKHLLSIIKIGRAHV